MPRRRPRRTRAFARTRRVGRAVRRGARRTYTRYAKRRARGRSLGLVGKTGVGILAGAPLGASALEAATMAVAQMQQSKLGLLSTANVAFWRFLNNMSQGFGMGNVRADVPTYNVDGAYRKSDVTGDIPSGSWYKTSVIGGTLIVWDIGISWLSRKAAKVSSGVRLFGMKLTGGK